MSKQDILSRINFGHRVAEDEADALERYFVETDHWRRLYEGEIDIIYGPKGSGKSALYSLLNSRRDSLFDRNILLVAAENPRGATAFRGLVADPPTAETEFKALWKLYFASLVAGILEEYGFRSDPAQQLRDALAREDLIPRGRSLVSLLRNVIDYVRGSMPPEAVSATLEIDPISGMPTGFTGRITFREPSADERQKGYVSVDTLLEFANAALTASGFSIWILLDRLDVAFVDSSELEQNALRSLFQVYRDISALDRIRLKIFLRTDIWRRITEGGFREASHITRHTTIAWDRQSLLNLIVSRAATNPALVEEYGIDTSRVLANLDEQEAFFYRLFPEQVDVGPNKPRTLDWMIGRTRDGSGMTAPREVIHLLNSLREVQVRRLEIGEAAPDDDQLFSRGAFKDALTEVSRARLEQTLYAEYPSLRAPLEQLRGQKTSYPLDALARIWGCSSDQAVRLSDQLIEAGFFEKRGTRETPEYWVPFLYRDALDLVQGSADSSGLPPS